MMTAERVIAHTVYLITILAIWYGCRIKISGDRKGEHVPQPYGMPQPYGCSSSLKVK